MRDDRDREEGGEAGLALKLIRKKGEVLGTVEADTEAEAIKAAIWQWGITDRERQRRLLAHRLDS